PPVAAEEGVAAPAFTLRQRLALTLVPPVVSVLLRLLGMTLRYRVSIEDGARSEYIPRTVYAFWHQCLLPAIYRYRDRHGSVMVSRSFDGELIARVVVRF